MKMLKKFDFRDLIVKPKKKVLKTIPGIIIHYTNLIPC